MANPVQVRVDVNDLKSLACSCGCEVFIPLSTFKLLPALCSPNGQQQLLTFPAAACNKCKKVYDMNEVAALAKVSAEKG